MKKLEIYIHIPFCVKKCAYCDFLSFPAVPSVKRDYVKALIHELDAFFLSSEYLRSDWWISSVFIGGGTPSVLLGEWIEEILEHIPFRNNCFSKEGFFKEKPEITIEANPGTLNYEQLLCFRQAGINRLSIGLQSVDDTILRCLGRIHTFCEFKENFSLARAAGFENISIDLMSGLPGQTLNQWEQTLSVVASMQPEHISAYGLLLEEGTPFYEIYVKKLSKQQEPLPDEEEAAQMYERTEEILKTYGYAQYEISNYAQPGRECQHNLGYWYCIDYIGFGLGSASLYKDVRFQNTANIEQYMEYWMEQQNRQKVFDDFSGGFGNNPCHEKIQRLSLQERMEETMILGLRCRKGVAFASFEQAYGKSMEEVYGDVIARYENMGFLIQKDGRLFLSQKALLVSNAILQDFMIV